MEAFCEQCHNLVSGVYKTSCKTGQGVEEMFSDIAKQLADANRYVQSFFFIHFIQYFLNLFSIAGNRNETLKY